MDGVSINIMKDSMVVEVGLEEIGEAFNWFDSLVTSPVQLTVSASTALTLNVEMGEGAFSHVFSGRLLSDGAGVPNKLVKIAVNGSVEDAMCTSSPGGEFSFALNLPPVNSKATGYQIRVMFEGDDCSSATAYSNVNGTDYAVCTTIQYGYKPSANSTWLTVEPQATQIATTTKTPEQTQAEAEQDGSLRVWHEFSWWFPWYRIHFVSVNEGVDQYDQGISPLPLVGATLTCSDTFLNIVKDLWSLAIWPIASAVAGAEFTALLASNAGPIGFSAALLISIGIKGLSLIANWNSINGLAGAFIGYLFSTAMGMLKWTWGFVADFLKLLMGIIDLAEFGLGNLYRILSFPIGIAYGGQILGRLHELGAIA